MTTSIALFDWPKAKVQEMFRLRIMGYDWKERAGILGVSTGTATKLLEARVWRPHRRINQNTRAKDTPQTSKERPSEDVE